MKKQIHVSKFTEEPTYCSNEQNWIYASIWSVHYDGQLRMYCTVEQDWDDDDGDWINTIVTPLFLVCRNLSNWDSKMEKVLRRRTETEEEVSFFEERAVISETRVFAWQYWDGTVYYGEEHIRLRNWTDYAIELIKDSLV